MRLLDLFCGAGGCAVGYHRAGFAEIVGVDNRPQPRYPFAFVEGDAMSVMQHFLRGGELEDKTGKLWHLADIDAIHASPPCQAHSCLRHMTKKEYPDLIAPVRDLLMRTSKPWVMENVKGAPFPYAIELCGLMFGLKCYRHRLFETSFFAWAPQHKPHKLPATGNKSVNKNIARGLGPRTREQCVRDGLAVVTATGHCGTYAGPLLGLDWGLTQEEISNAIPPAYTAFVGRQLMDHLRYRQS